MVHVVAQEPSRDVQLEALSDSGHRPVIALGEEGVSRAGGIGSRGRGRDQGHHQVRLRRVRPGVPEMVRCGDEDSLSAVATHRVTAAEFASRHLIKLARGRSGDSSRCGLTSLLDGGILLHACCSILNPRHRTHCHCHSATPFSARAWLRIVPSTMRRREGVSMTRTLDSLPRDGGWRALGWLPELSPTRDEVPRPASGSALIAEAEARLGKGPIAWVVEVGQRMATLIVREMPEFGGGIEAFDILRMGTESSTIQFLLNLADHSQERIATQESLDGVLDFVRRGIGMESVLRGTRLGHRCMSEAFLEACESLGAPGERVEDMKFLTVRLFEFMDTFSAQLAGRYLEDQVRWSTSDSAARLELVRALLAGSELDPAAAQRVLRYDLRGTHVALIAWSTSSASELDDIELQDACSRVLDRLEPTSRLVLPVGAGQVWAWGEMRSGGVQLQPSGSLPGFARGVRVAVSSTDSGIAGFRATHAEADAIRRLLPSSSLPPVTPYESVDVLTLLLEDRERAASFAARELGALVEPSGAHEDLRDTLAAFLDEHGSTQAAAARLIVARNTVSYRIRRAEEIMGRTIRERSVQLRIALFIAAAMPDAVAAARR